jgi:hypothetical protein
LKVKKIKYQVKISENVAALGDSDDDGDVDINRAWECTRI